MFATVPTLGAALVGSSIVVASIVGMSWSGRALQELRTTAVVPHDETPLYLPSAQYLKPISFGFENFLSDVLWFHTLNYFGRQISNRENLQWFAHMCTLVSDLDPKALHVYEFCGTLLSWVAKEPEASNAVLTKGIEAFPEYWRLRYLKAFNAWYFLNDQQNAAMLLREAATLPDAPGFLASLASRLLATSHDPRTAVQFLSEVLRNTSNPSARDAILDKLKHAQISLDLENLGALKRQFESTQGRALSTIQELVAVGLLKEVPNDPFGGRYYFDQSKGEFLTSSGEQGLTFEGRNATTGVGKKEFLRKP